MLNIKKFLNHYGLKPKKFMGQNFLIDEKILGSIIAAADLSKKDTVLEIGAGLGALTVELARNAGRVIAVEKDKNLAKILSAVLEKEKIENVKVIEKNILKLQVSSLKFHDYKVVANIPYYLTSPLIRKFLEAGNPPKEMILMVQKEVAQRICAKPPDMSLLGVAVQYYAKPEILFYVPRNSFWPKPEVDSAVIYIKPCNLPEIYQHRSDRFYVETFFKIVKAGFSSPRKQLLNNLSKGLNLNKEKIKTLLLKAGVEPRRRAETLSIKEWKKIVKTMEVGLQ